ncbi:type IV toxin-antitoxin system AbiEi family antitoxin domain-containing protein [Parapedobacter soli]|uniref:type IV toxin-antitoxin system AbiEi family antitoxin domain-containing protein n=1 Tax=Parapedobacter soli TaxID=416955 RepID=UPI0021C5D82A|nr:type IV toxin-antitoxin system AbiEi family antitoxin domain-containing protein [Parapedobacter soli]
MKSTHKQRLIVDYIREHGTITVEQCQSVPGVNTYYCNGAKHCGNLLRTMHKSGLLERLKKGTYQIPTAGRLRPTTKARPFDAKQQSLF